MHFVRKSVVVVGLSFLLFLLMQMLFGGRHCLDCAAKIGFPFLYMQEGTYGTVGHTLWLGFLGDFAIAFGISVLVVSVWQMRKSPANHTR